MKCSSQGLASPPHTGSRGQVCNMSHCPCPPTVPVPPPRRNAPTSAALPHRAPRPPWTSAPIRGKELKEIFLRVCFAKYLHFLSFPYPVTVDEIFFFYKIPGIILAQLSIPSVNKQLHSFYLQLSLLTVKNQSGNFVAGLWSQVCC